MLILYGEILAISSLIQYYFVVQMSQAMWVFIDGCTVPISWAITMARPAQSLAKTRPTARLLGFETVFSVFGQVIINLIFLLLTVAILCKQAFYVCHQFDSTFVDLRKWWELADNYEGSISGIMTTFQILHASCALSLGSKYRAGFWKNRYYLAIYFFTITVFTLTIISGPNPLGCAFRINCGTRDALESLGYTNISFSLPETYHNSSGHNVMPVYFRWIVVLLAYLNLAAIALWEGQVILGPGRQWFKKFANGRWQVKKETLRI